MSQIIFKCQQHSVTVGNDQKHYRQSDYYWQMSSWSLKPVCEKRFLKCAEEKGKTGNSLQMI